MGPGAGLDRCRKSRPSPGFDPVASRYTDYAIPAPSGYIQCIKLLVEIKSDFSMGDESGDTPLHLAAISGSADSAKYLIENGADLLLDNKDKHTTLHMVLNSLPDV